MPTGHPDFVFRPVVLGPDDWPLVTDLAQAREKPHLAILSAIAHGNSRKGALRAAVHALAAVDRDRQTLYADMVMQMLDKTAQREFEAMLQDYEYKSDFALRHIEKGREEGDRTARLELARKLLAEGMSETEVLRLTELGPEALH